MNVLVSACLLGEPCRYDGKAKCAAGLEEALAAHGCDIVCICPERDGGLPCPRPTSEIAPDGARVVNEAGEDVTDAFERGARIAVETACEHGCRLAVLKAKSPSCGAGSVYDGTFTGRLTEGDGFAVRALRAAGVRVVDERRFLEDPQAALRFSVPEKQ